MNNSAFNFIKKREKVVYKTIFLNITYGVSRCHSGTLHCDLGSGGESRLRFDVNLYYCD